ncbi:MAG: GrpE protein [Chthonomonadales bacterium]|nr:GrpE protein [Chthonomonadales bacterium]
MSDTPPHHLLPAHTGLDERHDDGQEGLPPGVSERLAALETAVLSLTQSQAETVAAMGEFTERLEKQLSRAGKELFKANALADAQQKSAETMLEQLRDSNAHRERELTQLRERLAEASDAGRLEVVRRLFPALDGLEEAIASGRRRLERATNAPKPAPSFWQRLLPGPRAVVAPTASQEIAAWLEGLGFVQERLLEALAAVDVVPIPTEGRSFDPHLHVAVETVPATGLTRSGAIVREQRRGYMQADTILRYAEVVVARENGER